MYVSKLEGLLTYVLVLEVFSTGKFGFCCNTIQVLQTLINFTSRITTTFLRATTGCDMSLALFMIFEATVTVALLSTATARICTMFSLISS